MTNAAGCSQESVAGSVDIYDPAFVKGVFDRCSRRYINFSYVCSAGFTERWRVQCVGALPPLADRARGYDLMAGTGEAWPHLLRRFPDIETITAVDISTGMHRLAMERLHKERAGRISFIEDNVFDSNLASESADFVVSTFGLKTFNAEQQAALAQLVARVLKPGGVFSFVEASDPRGWSLRSLYLFHLKGVLPLIERTLLRGAQDFAMIGAYCTNFGDCGGFAKALRAHGLDAREQRYFYGCATGVSGRKPVNAASASAG
ncbi:MAG TPA: class I SAM-dependent methyltransferase [Caulobacterales bacterium]|nr:class I SAM-dependent methyltransferase [Caulobacterales bacterium]